MLKALIELLARFIFDQFNGDAIQAGGHGDIHQLQNRRRHIANPKIPLVALDLAAAKKQQGVVERVHAVERGFLAQRGLRHIAFQIITVVRNRDQIGRGGNVPGTFSANTFLKFGKSPAALLALIKLYGTPSIEITTTRGDKVFCKII